MSKNVIEIDPQKFPWLDLNRYTFCMGAENAGIFYLSGQTASEYDPDQGKVVCKGDLIDQTKVIYEKLGVVLEAAGLGFENVVQTVDYVDPVGLPQYRQTGEVRRQYLRDTPVAATGICVERLLRPDALMEVSAVAMKGEKRVLDPGWDRFQQLTYVPGVEVEDIVWLSGFVGYEETDGQRHYPQETGRQVSLTYDFIGDVLRAAGSEPGDVVKSLDYIAPRAVLQYRDTGAVRRDFYGGQYPTATGIVVNRLLRPEGHVEIETVAVTGEGRQDIRVPEWEGRYGRLTYHPGVKKGHLLYLSGQGAVDHTTSQSVGGWDMAAQAEQAYSNIARVIAEAGYSMDDVVNTIEYVTPNALMAYRGVAEVRRKYFGDRYPSATGVVMHELLRPEMMIEVTAVAVV
jgi:enamine deaminase RidA (YjgF/YER057c/UK114 family)